jgi:DNA-binding MarR family transcriptional regulator
LLIAARGSRPPLDNFGMSCNTSQTPEGLRGMEMALRPDWRHDNTGRLLFDSTRRFQERALALVNRKGYPEMRIAHMAVVRHIDLTGTRIADLAVRAGVTKQSMGEMIDQLETMGFVARAADGSDKRAKIVTFTASGRKLLDVIRNAVAACERDLAARIGTRALGELRSALTNYCRVDDASADGKTPAEKSQGQRRMA